MINRIEIIDQSNGTGGFASSVYGGVSYRYLNIYFDLMNNASTIDFIINIYAEPLTPNDFFLGELTSDSELVHRQRIIVEYTGYYYFNWNGPYLITRVEARDQSIGDGGVVSWYYAGVSSVYIDFVSVYAYSKIDFFVDIYGVPVNTTGTSTPLLLS